MSTKGYKVIRCPYCQHDVMLSPDYYTHVDGKRVSTYPEPGGYGFVRSCWHLSREQANRIVFAAKGELAAVRAAIRAEITEEYRVSRAAEGARRVAAAKANPRRSPTPAIGQLGGYHGEEGHRIQETDAQVGRA